MPALKDVKTKINAVKKTKQITKAMNMVASAKLRNAQSRIERFRPYADKFYEMLGDLAKGADPSVHPLLEAHEEIKTVLMVVITSDRGLCGAFNNNITHMAMKTARKKAAEGKAVKFLCVGRKCRDTLRRSGFEIVQAHVNEMNAFDFSLATRIGSEVIGGYVGGTYDEVIMAFGKFVSLARQEPTQLTVLPLSPEEHGDAVQAAGAEYIYEPSVEGLLAELLPRFINVQLYRGLLDTSASEHAARMRSMDNATKNCDDLVSSLTLVYNKARQAAITKELMDIVGGSEALKG
ncbi:F0F1 ATP synthase subunit gamma [Desulfolutivibrio sulfoxidireducens]|uniref:F0F1 ATP synthase subunit gamma n=1 Tax=Desulfolutivibrio sulfoxidireducens TaxID=2773299 RepID=UPI00159D4697|nr:F0F1 ATP synthase subunit gamma [Desulfolutivibrio sulfoxidireducens]QLA15180.1 F0F1 ATP synthase subunit gamma [Desulfolutivibrio sulfoxidireducens]QLA18751.1 F0F1 ATP synthase subunit gamma [Desulfolutivibrio sulfoxidireducens]